MAAPLEKTRTPGIYKRGSRYVFSYRVDGQQKWESCRTLDEARRTKSARATDIARGEFDGLSRMTLHDYADEWIDRYQGGPRGIREATREDYRRILNSFVKDHFSNKLKLVELTPRHVSQYVQYLCDKDLSDKSVRNYVGPLSALMETARGEGLVRHNPVRGVRLPNRPKIENDDEEDVRALTTEQLATFLEVVDSRHRLFFELLAVTGVRVSEAIALQWRHIHLDGERPYVSVRQAFVRGHLGPPKSKHSRRNIPIPWSVADDLRSLQSLTEWPRDDDLVFPNRDGSYLHVGNLRRRVLKPAAEEAGASWAGFHTFRHTCASMLFRNGRNAVQVQHWLGHHSAAFTLSTYVHLLDGDVGEPLEVSGVASPQGVNKAGMFTPPESANRVRTGPTPLGDTTGIAEEADLAA